MVTWRAESVSKIAPNFGSLDAVVGGWTLWLRIVWGENSRQWKDIKSWHGGRWNAILDGLKKYDTVV
ncbi:hypothetical protein GALMADRAFT_923652 [Galerina marginata CBS 339.88]|uniref:Glutathione S-transferase UstS-like C-terminal domain-containing protein n=1 Tax=Galerina marginata (strain CBS 339.88) TaxID=685588 RepID=A0A067SDZ6_GALM3|nr:hypothetical protein GALMADRAFT_923652 [Galerina marginata CBS 339.88]